MRPGLALTPFPGDLTIQQYPDRTKRLATPSTCSRTIGPQICGWPQIATPFVYLRARMRTSINLSQPLLRRVCIYLGR